MFRHLSRIVFALLLLAAGAAGFAACERQADPGVGAAAPGEKVLRRVNDDVVKSLDPHLVSVLFDSRIIADMFEGLTTINAAGHVVPGQAESWTVSPDGLIWTFRLREGLKWSDGRPVNALDFVGAMRRLVSPQTRAIYAHFLFPVKNAAAIHQGKLPASALGVVALDDLILEIQLEQPMPSFAELLAQVPAAPVPVWTIRRYGDAWTQPDHIVVNGAFKLAAWHEDGGIELVKNPSYRAAGQVALDRVVYLPIQDDYEALDLFKEGEVDLVQDFPSERYESLMTEMPDAVRVYPYRGSYYYVFNTAVPPFDDVRVRRALSMALDRKRLVDDILRLNERPAYALVLPGIGAYGGEAKSDWASLRLEARHEEARKLLAEAGYGPGFPLKLKLSLNRDEDHQRLAGAMAAMWSSFGVETEFVVSNAGEHFEAMRRGDFEVGRSGWIADYNAAENFLFVFKSDNRGLNYARYDNPEFDRLLDQAFAEPDIAARNKLLREAEKILLADAPIIPLYYYVTKNLVGPRVKGWVDNIANQHLSRWLDVTGAPPPPGT